MVDAESVIGSRVCAITVAATCCATTWKPRHRSSSLARTSARRLAASRQPHLVPSLVEPGDMASFIAGPAPVGYGESIEDETGPAAAADGPQPRLAGSIDTIGPFRILSLGNRLGSAEVRRSSRMPTVQENVIAIAIEVDSTGNPIAQADKLLKMLNETNFRPMGILLHLGKGKTLSP